MTDMGVGSAPRWWRRGSTFIALTMVTAGCGSEVIFMGGSGGGSGSGAPGSGGSTGSVTNGSGGAGASSTVGSGGQGIPCDIDCATIMASQCEVAVCDETVGMCVFVDEQDGVPCDDDQFCTTDDSCVAGDCVGGPTNDCGLATDVCHQVSCDEVAKVCTAVPLSDGTPCMNNTNLCIINATCSAGLCVGPLNTCFMTPLPNSCHVAWCDPSNGLCSAIPGNDGASCIDTSTLCTVNNTCSSGTCSGGTPLDCSGLSQGCMAGVCDSTTGQCTTTPLPAGAQCAMTDCANGTCDNVSQCLLTPANEGGPCNDGLSCTTATICTAGVCGGGSSSGIVYFSEDFSDNTAGWTLGPEWQIGPAMSSSGGVGSPDPAQDHSTTSDNGIAGAVIGGNVSTMLHPMAYITSPPIDTSTVVGPLIFSYQRWLNSDYTPYMQNQVEVFDGNSWMVLWQSGSPPAVQDSAWSGQSHDITAHKAPNMQVRFGFSVGNTGAFTVSGWNLDDVVIADSICN